VQNSVFPFLICRKFLLRLLPAILPLDCIANTVFPSLYLSSGQIISFCLCLAFSPRLLGVCARLAKATQPSQDRNFFPFLPLLSVHMPGKISAKKVSHLQTYFVFISTRKLTRQMKTLNSFQLDHLGKSFPVFPRFSSPLLSLSFAVEKLFVDSRGNFLCFPTLV
jgi:hypothetical protein